MSYGPAQFRPKVEFFASFSLPGVTCKQPLPSSITNVELPFTNSASGKDRTGAALPSPIALHRPPVKDSDPTQGIVKAVLSVAQSMKHKRFAHKSVNEWRVHAVPPEMTGPGEPVGQPGNTAKAAA